MNSEMLRSEIYNFLNENLIGGEQLIVDAARHIALAKSHLWRPLIMLNVVNSFNKNFRLAKPIASALECTHCATLIMDDKPSEDNSSERRGKPSCHIKYGEDIADLAIFYLVCKSIEFNNSAPITDKQTREINLMHAKFTEQVLWGQKRDLRNLKDMKNPDDIIEVYRLKTGALMKYAAIGGGIIAKASEKQLLHLGNYGEHIGNSYQIRDCIYDVSSGDAFLGKPKGQDEGKNTLVRLIGEKKATEMANKCDFMAIEELKKIRGINTESLEKLLEDMKEAQQPKAL